MSSSTTSSSSQSATFTVSSDMFISCEQLSYLVTAEHYNMVLICAIDHPSQCDFLIRHTVREEDEAPLINQLASSIKAQKTTNIVLYSTTHHPKHLTSLIQKRKRICALGFVRVYIYLGGLTTWITNWSFYSREQFPICLSSLLVEDLNARRPPTDADPQEKWDSWMRFLVMRLMQQVV